MSFAWIDLPEENRRLIVQRDESWPAGVSAVQRLIEGIYEMESLHTPSRARTLLRERIYSTEELSISDCELVKSAAKRCSAPRPLSRLPSGFREEMVGAPRTLPDFSNLFSIENRPKIVETLHALQQISTSSAPGRERWASDRPISAMLLSQEGEVLGFAWNTNAVIRNRHAEWNLCEVLRTSGKKLPAGATLYTSLKPCRMCAARIWETAEDPAHLQVRYLENDPGRLAQETLLEANSAARLRYLGKNHPLFSHPIESPI